MSDFADVEKFAREHASCGGLTPNATSRPGREGYLLTITCACGAIYDRWVTAAEASQPLPRPSSVAAPVPAWPARPTTPRPQRIEVAPARRASRGRAVWLVLFLLVAVGAGAVAYWSGGVPDRMPALPGLPGLPGQRAAAPRTVPPPTLAPPPPAPAPPPALDTITRSLRELQSSITPGMALNDYASHVATARAEVERLAPGAPEPGRTRAREVVDLHRLAVSAWRARTVDDRDEWERLGQDPDVELCPAVKRAADAAPARKGSSRAQTRGVAVAAGLPQLWECAAGKVAALQMPPGAPVARPSVE
jgi:hypothetical protein